MSKQIQFNNEALKRGIDTVADAVKVTIGAKGRNVALDMGYGTPLITNDGVSIAREIVLEDKFENMGASVIKEVAFKTNDKVGDGTTTSIILTQAIINSGLQRIQGGMGVMEVKRAIEKATKEAITELKKLSKDIKSKKEIEQIATISSESEELGKIIAKTIDKVGSDGMITVEESPNIEFSSEIVKGLELDQGYMHHFMITDFERMKAEYKFTPILVTDQKITSIKQIKGLLEAMAEKERRELVIFARDAEPRVLKVLLENKLKGLFNVLVVKIADIDPEDIAIIVGTKVISDMGTTLEEVTLDMLGTADGVVATKDKTVISGGIGDTKQHIEQLKEEGGQEERIARLSNGIAVIKVGTATDTEMKYLKLKIEDAINATQCAIEEGVVQGGGLALQRIADSMPPNILSESLQAPYRQIQENNGEPLEVGENVIDPVKVTRTALENASSASAMFLTTDVAIADVEKDIVK